MNWALLSFLALTLAVATPTGCVGMSKDLMAIEKYLTSRVDSSDLELNFKNLQDWADKPQKSLCGLHLCGKKPVESLHNLISLYEASENSNGCSRETLNLALNVRDAAGIDYDWIMTSNLKKYRLSDLLFKIGSRLASNCLRTELELFREKLDTLDYQRMEPFRTSFELLHDHIFDEIVNYPAGSSHESSMRYLINEYLDRDTFPISPRSFVTFIRKVHPFSITQQTFEERKIELVEKFFQDFFLLPCDYYQREMEHLAEPLINLVYLRKRNLPFLSSIDDFETYEYIGQYVMCKKFNDKQRSIIKVIVEYVAKF